MTDAAILLIGGLIFIALGGWTVTCPNGGYRAAGGAGSGVGPGTRRVAGFAFIAMGILLMVFSVTD